MLGQLEEEALKQRRTQRKEAIDEEGKKTWEVSPLYRALEEKDASHTPRAEEEKDTDNGVPVPTPPVIPKPKDSEKHVPVPSPPEVPAPKESEKQVPVSPLLEVPKEQKAVSPAPRGAPRAKGERGGRSCSSCTCSQEDIEELGEAPKDEKMPTC